MKLGDAVHSVLHPIAENIVDPVLGTDLHNCGGCGKRREWLNNLGDAIYDELFEPRTKGVKNNAVSSDPHDS